MCCPAYNEWYRAAYYNPTNSTYYDFPNGSNTAPTAVASGTVSGTAVYNQFGPADVDQAGGLSPYGVMGLGGNVREWEESSRDLLNNVVSGTQDSNRGVRGGTWAIGAPFLSSSFRGDVSSATASTNIGFRVASLSSSAPPAVPEPSMMVIGKLFGIGGLMAKRRMKK